MKTTLYGNGQATNELGHPKEAKETSFVNPHYLTRDPISLSTLRDLIQEFHEANGTYPKKLFIAGPSNGTRHLMLRAAGPDSGPFVSLSVTFDAEETHVE